MSFVAALPFLIIELQFFFIMDVQKRNGSVGCKLIRVPKNYWDIFDPIDSVIYSFCPFTLMILANSAIIYKLMMAKFRSAEASSQALSKSATRGTAMLLIVSIGFIILTGPRAVITSIKESNPVERVVLDIMQYLNHAINGMLYCAVGPKFRRKLVKALCSCKNNRIQNVTGSNTGNNPTGTASPI